jgi:hypothetical protein
VARHYAPELVYRESPASLDTLNRWLNGAGALWVIAPYHRNGLVADASGLESWLFEHCRQVLRTERPRFDYRVYRVDLFHCGGQVVVRRAIAARPPVGEAGAAGGLP